MRSRTATTALALTAVLGLSAFAPATADHVTGPRHDRPVSLTQFSARVLDNDSVEINGSGHCSEEGRDMLITVKMRRPDHDQDDFPVTHQTRARCEDDGYHFRTVERAGLDRDHLPRRGEEIHYRVTVDAAEHDHAQLEGTLRL
ncbi:hypothetical protein ACIGXM_27340 [Kitasatospora sp. NPDC052896]|uniref:hypothetical protein n=1 Tax=Kitasatospora sp. NPDC052896 TaxID=3364061 RepID=UPI0037CA531D